MNMSDHMAPAVQTTQSPAWIVFTYVAFAMSLVMVIGGILVLPIDLWMRGYLLIGILMVVQACLTLSKTQRDAAENARLVNRVEMARTEKLLMDA